MPKDVVANGVRLLKCLYLNIKPLLLTKKKKKKKTNYDSIPRIK
jgi:hypothetical protein